MASPRFFFLTVCVLAIGLAGCADEGSAPREIPAENQIPFRTDGELQFLRDDGTPIERIEIEIADTDSARARGLMQRTSLPPGSGMLFIFDREEPQSFWMANTPLALDIFFVNRNLEIVSIKKYTRPFSPQSVVSDAPAQYVIETPAGYADSRGITEGDRVVWKRRAESSEQ